MNHRVLWIDLDDLDDLDAREPGEDEFAARHERLAELRRLAPLLGFELDVLGKQALLDQEPGALDVAERLRWARSLWWGGRIAFQRETEPPWQHLLAHCRAARATPALYEAPDVVEESFNLSLSQPRLAAAGVRQPRTVFVPLEPETAALRGQELETALAERLAAVELFEHGFFVRTYYGTRKFNHMMNFAHSPEALVSRSVSLVEELATYQEIGGLALREPLQIALFTNQHGSVLLGREFRVFIAHGQPLMWSMDVDLPRVRDKFSPAELSAGGARTEEQHATLLEVSRQLGAAISSRFVVADFAILESGELRLVEVNPGQSSGWAHPAAYVGVYGRFFRRLAGLPDLDPAGCAALCEEAGIDLWGRGELWDFL